MSKQARKHAITQSRQARDLAKHYLFNDILSEFTLVEASYTIRILVTYAVSLITALRSMQNSLF